MILSASRRTDIPAYYSEWLINRLHAGFIFTRNTMNHDVLDVLCFKYNFQFTVTPYDKSVEQGLRDKEEIIKTFCELSDRIGKDKVLWRYDPIILNDMFDFTFHKEQFSRICSKLGRHTRQCIISFVDIYSKLRTDILREISMDEMIELG